MKIQNISSLLRGLEPGDWTNLTIGTASLLVTLAGGIYQLVRGNDPLAAGWWGLNLGLGLFLGWAIGREIDPDHPISALAAAALSLIAMLLWGLPALGAGYWLLVVSRMVTRSTGLPPTISDSLILLGVSVWLCRNGNWVYPLIMALAFSLDGRLRAGMSRQYYFSALTLAFAGFVFVSRGIAPDGLGFAPVALLAAFTLGVASLPPLFAKREIHAVADFRAETLDLGRVSWSGRMALLAGLLFALHSGFAGLVAVLPAWAALLSATIWWILERFR